jgi:hypothetical protein
MVSVRSIRLSTSWWRRTLSLIALALAIVAAVSLCLRLANIPAPGAPWPLIILACAAWGALISTLYSLLGWRGWRQPS